MKLRLSCIVSIMALLIASGAFAQTIEPHISFGMKPSRSTPPEVIDMSGLDSAVYGPMEGKRLQVFILWGEFGRQGQWLSRYLPEEDRAGRTGTLMFEDGQWQPLRPVGVRHGLEIPFGAKMAERMSNETLGIILVAGTRNDAITTATKAILAAPCDIVAFVRFNGQGKGIVDDAFKNRLGTPEILDIELPTIISCSPSDLDQLERIQDRGNMMSEAVLKRILTTKE